MPVNGHGTFGPRSLNDNATIVLFGVALMVTKEHILQEIKQTAAENGGSRSDNRSSSPRAGITKSDWEILESLGRCIRRSWLFLKQFTKAYEDTYLLDKYAQFAIELGSLPTWDDLRRKACSTPEFPSRFPFRRLGAKPELVKRLLEYCQSHEGYEDVTRMCRKYFPPTRETSDESVKPEESFGFVYLIKSGRFYKIGKAKDADYRVGAIRLQLPEKAKRIHEIEPMTPPASRRTGTNGSRQSERMASGSNLTPRTWPHSSVANFSEAPFQSLIPNLTVSVLRTP